MRTLLKIKKVHKKGLVIVPILTFIITVISFYTSNNQSVDNVISMITYSGFISLFLYYVIYQHWRRQRGFDDYEKKPKFTKFLLFEGYLEDGREITINFKMTGEIYYDGLNLVNKSYLLPKEEDTEKNFWISDNTHQMRRTIWFQSSNHFTVSNIKTKIDELIGNQQDVLNGLYEYYSINQEVEKNIFINPRRRGVLQQFGTSFPDLKFEDKQIIKKPSEIKMKKLVEENSKNNGFSIGKKVSIEYFDNGQIVFCGHDYVWGDKNDKDDSEYEFDMTIFKNNVSSFEDILTKVKDPSDVQTILRMCVEKNIEPLFSDWSS